MSRGARTETGGGTGRQETGTGDQEIRRRDYSNPAPVFGCDTTAGEMLSSRSMIPQFWVCVTTVVFGLAVLAWPEQDSRMFVALSERHGPSMLDLIGLAFMLAGYVPLAARVWSRRTPLRSRFGAAWLWLVALVLVSWAGLAAGLAMQLEPVLWTSVAASTLVQTVLVVPAFLR